MMSEPPPLEPAGHLPAWVVAPGRRQRLAVLGSTGSIGVSTLDVVARHPDRFEVHGLSAHSRIDDLAAQCRRFLPSVAVVPDAAAADRLREALSGDAALRGLDILTGADGLCRMAAAPEVDSVMAAIVGAAGLAPCLAAARAGKRLLLANKEALVVGGALFMDAVREGGATLLPIDSEHSAIFQCLPLERTQWPAFIDHIVLTASGGPFRTRDVATFGRITPQEAVAHPNWVMGRKISVDSATMMNKALEVIEARWLFDLPPERIRVVIHPQSVVHSMVVCRDGSVMAQMGTPDMRVPIAYGLAHPQRIATGAATLDFTRASTLSFEPLDAVRFPALALAYRVLEGPAGGSVILNAANEVAVAAFLDGGLSFTGIHDVNRGVLDALEGRHGPLVGLEDLVDLDGRARREARRLIETGGMG